MPDNVLKSLWDAMLKFDFEMLRQEVHSITSEGYPVAAFLCQLHDMIIDSSTLKDIDKAYMTEKIAIVSVISLVLLTNAMRYHTLFFTLSKYFNE